MDGKLVLRTFLLSVCVATAGLTVACSAGAANGRDVETTSTANGVDCTDPLYFALCHDTEDTRPSGDTVAPGGFVPGEIIAALPVFPGARGSVYQGSGQNPPPAQPSEIGFCDGDEVGCPGLQTALAQYETDASAEGVLSWYLEKLTTAGYQRLGGGYGYSGEPRTHVSSLTFWTPDNPNVSVQVHIYYWPDNPRARSVFKLLVAYQKPLPRPVNSYLPPNIDRVDVTYVVGGVDAQEVTRAVTNRAEIERLLRIVNRMSVRADWVHSCQIRMKGEEDPSATLTFHSPEGEWVVREILGCPHRVEFVPHPDLQDSHHLLWDTVGDLLGVGRTLEAADPPLPLPGNVPTPLLPIPGYIPTPTPAPR